MKIKKINDTYNTYQLEVSFGQLVAFRDALAADHSNPLADESYAEISWYLQNIPGPGESEEDLKKAEEASESGLASPEAAENPNSPKLSKPDDLLPAPGEEGEGAAEELPPEAEEAEPMPEEEPGEANRHVPPAPEE